MSGPEDEPEDIHGECALEVSRLRAELAAATAEVERAAYQRHRAEERADFEARRCGQVDATWRKMWDESVGKIARGEALLAPTPPIVINDPSGFVANQARDLAAARAELAAVTERAERALRNGRLDGVARAEEVLRGQIALYPVVDGVALAAPSALNQAAEILRAEMEELQAESGAAALAGRLPCEDASCAKCKSGEPCH